jgi:uncharacterized surface protein with fasciclin (FAS1) repeats
MYRWIRSLLAVSTVAFLAACGSDDDEPQVQTKNIVETASADPQFSILVEAVGTEGLADTLSGPGPYTVFAPTNDAFAALLGELGLTKAQLLADKALLTAVLTYHVLPAQVKAADVPLGKAVTTVEGGVFKVESAGGELVITDGRNRTAKITATDVMASNGVIHVVDRVILPADKSLVATALSQPQFSVLVDAISAAGLADALSGPGPFTVFAPTDDAFAALLAELVVTRDELFADTALLKQVLLYHVVDGRVLKADVPLNTPIATLQTQTFSVHATLAITDQRARKARIVATDVFASNGVIHVIDKVILPSAP